MPAPAAKMATESVVEPAADPTPEAVAELMTITAVEDETITAEDLAESPAPASTEPTEMTRDAAGSPLSPVRLAQIGLALFALLLAGLWMRSR